MPGEVSASATYQGYYTPSSYATASSSASQTASSRVQAGIGITETTPAGDTVEISGEGASSQGGRGGTYTPRSFSDRFRFDINRGFLGPRNRFHVNVVSAGSEAAATYAARGQAGGLVVRGGLAGMYGAIFSLGYQDGSPTGTSNGIANRQAINEFRRIADQNLPLLSTIG